MDRDRIMNYKPFDTHKYIKSLQETGFNEQQAEVLVKSLLESKDFDLSFLATREQIVQLDNKIDYYRKDTKGEIENLRKDIKAEINGLRKDTKLEIDDLRKNTKAEIDSLRKGTKTEIDSLRKDTKAEIDFLRKDQEIGFGKLTTEIAKSKNETLKWFIGMFVILVTAIIVRPYLG